MNIDRDPGDKLFEQIEVQKEVQEAEKQRLMGEDLWQRLKDFGVAVNIWVGKLPKVEEEELPEIDGIIGEALKRVRMKHDVRIPEREN